ncbi:hypothetical protein [Jiella sp. M17.18]|uniref:hypothetical protein n=1 Tax=Jiella sp. M17.18 TaxID=3234247 RepID=UPI0034DFEFE0
MPVRAARCVPVLLVGLGAVLSGCTGSDITIGMGPNGPIPPADIQSVASTTTVGAPMTASNSLPAPAPSYRARSTPRRQRVEVADAVTAGPLLAPASSAGEEEPVAAEPAPSSHAAALPPPRQPRHRREPVRSQPVRSMARQESLPPAQAEPEAAEVRDQAQEQSQSPLLLPAASKPSPRLAAATEPPLRSAPAAASTRLASTAKPYEVQFLPIVGTPERQAELLARALSQESAAAGVQIRPAAGPKSNVRLKGYFAAYDDGGSTTLNYVWDVLDPSDKRVHRIQGQEHLKGTASDPWSLVTAETLRDVARKTLQEAAGLEAAGLEAANG